MTSVIADSSRRDVGGHNWLFCYAGQIGSVFSGRTCSPNTEQLVGNTQGDNGAWLALMWRWKRGQTLLSGHPGSWKHHNIRSSAPDACRSGRTALTAPCSPTDLKPDNKRSACLRTTVSLFGCAVVYIVWVTCILSTAWHRYARLIFNSTVVLGYFGCVDVSSL